MAINPNTAFSDGTPFTANQANRFPRGIVGAQTLTTTFVTSAAHNVFQDTGQTLTLSLDTSRIYRIMLITNPYPASGLQAMAFRMLEGGVEKYIWNVAASALETGSSVGFTFTAYFTPVSAASTIYKIQLRGVSSNTAVNDYGAANQPRQFWIEDVGPA